MLDIRLIREKPDFVRERLATRNGGDDAKIERYCESTLSGAKARLTCNGYSRSATV